MKKSKKKSRTWQEQLRLLISVVIAGIMVIAFGVILYTVLSVRIQVSDTNGITPVIKTAGTGLATPGPTDGPMTTGGIVIIQSPGALTPDDGQPQNTPAPTEEPKEKAPVAVDFSSLSAINGDVAAWLYSEGTEINYPVVYRDNTFYMNHSFDGKKVNRGTLFIHEDNDPDFADENTSIYGHNMTRTGDGVMFSSLVSYKKQSYYEKHPCMYLLTPHGDYKVEIFAAYLIDIFEDTIPITFASDSAYGAYLADIRGRSDIQSAVTVTPADRILSLVTCTQDHESTERYLVVGKLTPLA